MVGNKGVGSVITWGSPRAHQRWGRWLFNCGGDNEMGLNKGLIMMTRYGCIIIEAPYQGTSSDVNRD